MSTKKTICSFRKLWIESLDKQSQNQFLKDARESIASALLLPKLKLRRGKGRNDYPVPLLWECAEEIIARKLSSLSSLSPIVSKDIPSPFSFSRFLASIADAPDLIDQQLFEMADPGEISAIGAVVLQKQRYKIGRAHV